MNDTGEITLNLGELDTRGLALCWGLASSYAKDGNLLFSRLGNCFQREYAIRTGKGSTVEHLPAENTFDFEEYSIEDLRQAYAHFSCLSAAFERNGKRSSSKFCNAIVLCISNALDSHSEAGHA
jgi:hypothetical protein